MRRICYISGSRADFGLFHFTLQALAGTADLSVSVCVTGMHLSAAFGGSVADIERTGLRIAGRVRVPINSLDGAGMAQTLAQELAGIVRVLQREHPDIVMVLGDRGEMLAGAIAALHLGIVIVHIHGGEVSGTVDEPIRHAISKLSHYHFVATSQARTRLLRMGEHGDSVFVVGAPGLDGIAEAVPKTKATLCSELGLRPDLPVALVVFHPVVQDADRAAGQFRTVIAGVSDACPQIVCLAPNADAGGASIRAQQERLRRRSGFRLLLHLPRPDFLSWLSVASVMAGNSSSGVIEAASFGLRVVDIGDRQQSRERSRNVVTVPVERTAIRQAVAEAIRAPRRRFSNVYGDGKSTARIVRLLRKLPLNRAVLKKTNAY